jgi:LacI family transcriptional regulator, galactose operon repressor
LQIFKIAWFALLTCLINYATLLTRVSNTRYLLEGDLKTRRVTSQDVAERAGVSRTTVSFVLNNVEGAQIGAETRQRVLQAAKDLGYVPDAVAQSLASGKSKTIGLVLARPSRQIAADMYLTQVLDSLFSKLHKYGLRLILEILDDQQSQKSHLKLIRSKRMDGVIYSGPQFNDETLESLLNIGFPTVLMGYLPDSPFCSIDIDNYQAARTATEHLIDCGHTSIACITNASLSYTAAKDRLQGYRDVLESNHICYDESLVRCGAFTPESGYIQMKNMLASQSHLPTAAFIASDVVAAGAVAAIHEKGLRIPEDIAIVGFDDVPLARYMSPPLTTIQIPIRAMAQLAFSMIMQLINNQPPEEKHIFLETRLIVRKSSSPSN